MRRLTFMSGMLVLIASSSALAQGGSAVLSVDGRNVGTLHSASGGAIGAEVINEATKGAPFSKKHLGAIQYDAFEIATSFGLDRSFYELINKSFSGGAIRFDGVVSTIDLNGKIKQEREFRSAVITEVGFPGLDGASKEVGLMTIKMKPTTIRVTGGSGSSAPSPGIKNKPWALSNFRFDMDGLDTRRVTKIEPFTVKRIMGAPTIVGPGGAIGPDKDSRIEYPNLKITLSEAFAKPWQQWLDDFVIAGNNSDGQEKSGSIVMMAADMRTELGRINLSQCGIFRLSETKAANGALVPGLLTAEIYCEQMIFDLAK